MFRNVTVNILIMLTFVLFFSGCHPAKKPSLSRVQQNENLCGKHPFLQAYQCSFDQVQWAARKGDPHAQYVLGYLYYYGIGVLPNSKLALKWITEGAKNGDLSARNALVLLSPTKDTMVSTTNTRNSLQKQSKRPRNRQRLGNSTCTDNQGYTIQVAGSQNLSKLRQFAQTNQRYFKTDTFIYRKTFNNAPWYVLTYGKYSTYGKAQQKLYNLPDALKSYQPWVKSCASLLPS